MVRVKFLKKGSDSVKFAKTTRDLGKILFSLFFALSLVVCISLRASTSVGFAEDECHHDTLETYGAVENENETCHKIVWKCSNEGCDKCFSDQNGGTEFTETETEKLSEEHEIEHNDAKAANCKEAGYEEYYQCKNCGMAYTKDGEPIGDADALTAWKNVGGAGYIAIDPTAHPDELTKTDEIPATCTTPGTKAYWSCGTCGRYFSDADGNNLIGAADALTTWKNTSQADGGGQIPIDPTNHTNLQKVDKIDPKDCQTPGVQAYWHCDGCGKNYEDSEGKPGNEITEGIEQWRHGEGQIDPSTHTLTETPATPATCTTPGHIAGYECSVCGKHFSDAEGKTPIDDSTWKIPATGHIFGETIEAKEPTCTQKGNRAYKQCTVCKKYFDSTDTIYSTDYRNLGDFVLDEDAQNHSWKTESYDDPILGGKYRKCTECGKVEIDKNSAENIRKNQTINVEEVSPTKYPDGSFIGDNAFKVTNTKAIADGEKSVAVQVIVEDPLNLLEEKYIIKVNEVGTTLSAYDEGNDNVERAYHVDMDLFTLYEGSDSLVVVEEAKKEFGMDLSGGKDEDGDIKFNYNGSTYLIRSSEDGNGYTVYQQISGDIGGYVRILLEVPDGWDVSEIKAVRLNDEKDSKYKEAIEYRLFDE
ncbi:MAG: hypothetical protein IJ758_00845, partial [Clostridia bacterium]|nr:hypothetical protein [Clostridia bacterium]